MPDIFIQGYCPKCLSKITSGRLCKICKLVIKAIEIKDPCCSKCNQRLVVKQSQQVLLQFHKVILVFAKSHSQAVITIFFTSQLQSQLTNHLECAFRKGTWSEKAKQDIKAWILTEDTKAMKKKWTEFTFSELLTGYSMGTNEENNFKDWFHHAIGLISMTAEFTEHWREWWCQPEKVHSL